jgi:hypothetical protein
MHSWNLPVNAEGIRREQCADPRGPDMSCHLRSAIGPARREVLLLLWVGWAGKRKGTLNFFSKPRSDVTIEDE